MAGVGGVDHVGDLDVGLELLHEALEDPLGAGPVDLDLDPRVRGLEELGDLLGAGQGEGGVPDDLAFLLRRLQARVLRRKARGGRTRSSDSQSRC